MYGVPDTDDVHFGFICSPGSGQAKLVVFDDTDTAPRSVELRSGATARVYDLAAPEQGEPILEAGLKLDHSVIAAFTHSGALSIVSQGSKTNLSARTIADQNAIAQFWENCRIGS